MNTIIKIKFGSHLYGTNTPESDLDIKGIYIPELRDIVLGKVKKTIQTKRSKAEGERNTKDDVDVEIFSLCRFLELLAEGQTVALDLLFANAENIIDVTDLGSYVMYEIDANRDKILTKNVNAFVGYARQQAAKYGIKGSRMDAVKRTVALLETLPIRDKLFLHEEAIHKLVVECESLISLEKTALVEVVMIPGPDKVTLMPHLHVCGRKVPFGSTVKFARDVFGRILQGYGDRAHKASVAGGIDWKALSHAVRVNNEALELLETGKITFPRPDREVLLKIKNKELPYDEVANMIEEGLAKLYEAQEKSTLRDEPDYEWIENFIYQIYIRSFYQSISFLD